MRLPWRDFPTMAGTHRALLSHFVLVFRRRWALAYSQLGDRNFEVHAATSQSSIHFQGQSSKGGFPYVLYCFLFELIPTWAVRKRNRRKSFYFSCSLSLVSKPTLTRSRASDEQTRHLVFTETLNPISLRSSTEVSALLAINRGSTRVGYHILV